MINHIYKWTREQWTRENTSSRWQYDEDETETLWITPQWFEVKTGDEERAFWEGIGATFDVNGDDDYTECESVRPDGCAKFCETFEAVYINTSGAGWREREALAETEELRTLPQLETTTEHVVIELGRETTAHYDIVTGRWC